jgi:hypothetical protein
MKDELNPIVTLKILSQAAGQMVYGPIKKSQPSTPFYVSGVYGAKYRGSTTRGYHGLFVMEERSKRTSSLGNGRSPMMD